jgi:tetratricopeptide (TPR) repeat protein
MLRFFVLFGMLPMVVMACSTPQAPLVVLEQKADHEFDYQRWEKASEYYAEIVERDPGNEKAQFHYGVSLMNSSEYTKAEGALLTAHALEPENDEIVIALAEVMDHLGEHAKLFAMLRNRANDNRSSAIWMVVVDYSEKRDDYDSALEAVRNACAVDNGEDARPYYRAAVLLGKIGQSDEAIRRLRQAYAIDPGNVEVNALLVEYGEVPGPTLGLAPGR